MLASSTMTQGLGIANTFADNRRIEILNIVIPTAGLAVRRDWVAALLIFGSAWELTSFYPYKSLSRRWSPDPGLDRSVIADSSALREIRGGVTIGPQFGAVAVTSADVYWDLRDWPYPLRLD
jgi:hypothetical protein